MPGIIKKQEYPVFHQELHGLALAHFAKAGQQRYYSQDEYQRGHTCTWKNISWQELCLQLAIPYDVDHTGQ